MSNGMSWLRLTTVAALAATTLAACAPPQDLAEEAPEVGAGDTATDAEASAGTEPDDAAAGGGGEPRGVGVGAGAAAHLGGQRLGQVEVGVVGAVEVVRAAALAGAQAGGAAHDVAHLRGGGLVHGDADGHRRRRRDRLDHAERDRDEPRDTGLLRHRLLRSDRHGRLRQR